MTGRAKRPRAPASALWPEDDRDAWAKACAAPNDFDLTIPIVSTWRPRTRRNAEGYYTAWIKWLTEQRPDLLALSAGERVTRKVVKVYAKSQRDRGLKPRSVASAIANLGMAMMALVPEGDWLWLFAAARVYNAAAKEPDFVARIPTSAALFSLGEQLMAEAAAPVAKGSNVRKQAAIYRDGLLISLLSVAPLRRLNLTSLHLGTTVRRVGSKWKTALGAHETKNSQPFECAWPEPLVPALELYLDHHRHLLLDGRPDHGALWVSYQRSPLTEGAITAIVRRVTEQGLGFAWAPHRFRHSAATTMAEANPDGVTTIAALLGHASVGPSQTYYNKAKSGRAFEFHGEIIRPKSTRSRVRSPRQPSLFD